MKKVVAIYGTHDPTIRSVFFKHRKVHYSHWGGQERRNEMEKRHRLAKERRIEMEKRHRLATLSSETKGGMLDALNCSAPPEVRR